MSSVQASLGVQPKCVHMRPGLKEELLSHSRLLLHWALVQHPDLSVSNALIHHLTKMLLCVSHWS